METSVDCSTKVRLDTSVLWPSLSLQRGWTRRYRHRESPRARLHPETTRRHGRAFGVGDVVDLNRGRHRLDDELRCGTRSPCTARCLVRSSSLPLTPTSSPGSDPIQPLGVVPASWLALRVSSATLSGVFCVVTAKESLPTLRTVFLRPALHYGLTDLNDGALRLSAPRAVTQLQRIAAWLYDLPDGSSEATIVTSLPGLQVPGPSRCTRTTSTSWKPSDSIASPG